MTSYDSDGADDGNDSAPDGAPDTSAIDRGTTTVTIDAAYRGEQA